MAGGTEPGIRSIAIRRVSRTGGESRREDFVAVEEPLEVQVGFTADGTRQTRTLSITMRTPGHDCELAAGFLFTEGVLHEASQIAALLAGRNSVRAELRPDVEIRWPEIERHVYTSSSCGICGRTSIDAVRSQACPIEVAGPRVDGRLISALPERLRAAQPAFQTTGGLHAAGLFTASGDLLDVREDVGRHNALDKLIGVRFLAGELPLSERIVVVSGRASFELVQKALTAGVPVLAAVGAPSSLAVDLAQDAGMTLVGFVRTDGFNIYSGAQRVTE